jgi:hypothetical protein
VSHGGAGWESLSSIKAQCLRLGASTGTGHEASHCLCSAAAPAGLSLARGQPQQGSRKWERDRDLGLGPTCRCYKEDAGEEG